MVRIRLRRTGAKNNPTYRIVVADVRAPRDGDFIESIGHYLPTRQPHVVEINEERARHWISKGAQPSDTAATLLRQKGILNALNKLSVPGEEVIPRVYPAKPAPVVEAPTVEETPAAPIETPVADVAETSAVQEENSAVQAETSALQEETSAVVEEPTAVVEETPVVEEQPVAVVEEAPAVAEEPVAQAEPIVAEATETVAEQPAMQSEPVAAPTEPEPAVEATA